MELNKVYNDDIMNVLRALPDNSMDMIYSDPDYNVGIKYNGTSYKKAFDEYVDWYVELARESLRVLKPTGNMFFINYPKQNAYLRVKFLDEHCHDVFDYAWVYNSNVGHSPRKFTTAHRSILHCTKSGENHWYKEQVAEPYKNPTDKRILQNIANGSRGRMPYSWFYYDLVKNVSKDKTIHSCQIPKALVEKLILACTKPDDVVMIHFGGSGGEIVQAKEMGRRFISAELEPKYYEMILDRLANDGEISEQFKLKLKKNTEPAP